MAADEPGRDSKRQALERRLAGGSSTVAVYTSPERKTSETAALALPSVAANIREQLREVKRPSYSKPKEFTDAVADYLKGELVEGWESSEDIAGRLASLKVEIHNGGANCRGEPWRAADNMDPSRDIRLADPLGFWSNLRMPDAWELDTEEKSLTRLA